MRYLRPDVGAGAAGSKSADVVHQPHLRLPGLTDGSPAPFARGSPAGGVLRRWSSLRYAANGGSTDPLPMEDAGAETSPRSAPGRAAGRRSWPNTAPAAPISGHCKSLWND